jgi:hypothetical protein
MDATTRAIELEAMIPTPDAVFAHLSAQTKRRVTMGTTIFQSVDDPILSSPEDDRLVEHHSRSGGAD